MIFQYLRIPEEYDLKSCVLVFGHFSSIHPGHIRYLQHARTLGSTLVLALLGDRPSQSFGSFPYSQSERASSLHFLDIIDAIAMLEGDEISKLIPILEPSIFVLGSEYKGSAYMQDALDILFKAGGKVQYHSGDLSYNTSSLLLNSEDKLRDERRAQFINSCEKQNISCVDLLDATCNWNSTKLIVVGDSIIDEYIGCEALGMSAEAPLVVVRQLASRKFIGGAAVVASHIKSLGASCEFISVTGSDEESIYLANQLTDFDVEVSLISDPSRPTTLKQRFLVENQKIFRLSRIEVHNISAEVEDLLISKILNAAQSADGIIISDFVYGVITPRIMKEISRIAKRFNLKLFADVQCSSQVGSISKFHDYTLLSPNERELRLALQDKDAGLEQLSQQLIREASCQFLVVKLASEGVIAYDRDVNNKIFSQSFPALSVNPLDVTGAGDSMLAVMSISLASKQSLMIATALATCAASIAVESMGNAPISSAILLERVRSVYSYQ